MLRGHARGGLPPQKRERKKIPFSGLVAIDLELREEQLGLTGIRSGQRRYVAYPRRPDRPRAGEPTLPFQILRQHLFAQRPPRALHQLIAGPPPPYQRDVL